MRLGVVREPVLKTDVKLDADGRAAPECLQRRRKAAFGENRRVNAPRELAEARRRPSSDPWLPASPRPSGTSSPAGIPCLSPDGAGTARVTSRCCAPSCRSRSIRRRASSPAATIRPQDAAELSADRRVGDRG